MLAPVAYVDHTTSPIRLHLPGFGLPDLSILPSRMIAEFSQWLQWTADHMGPAEFLPSNWLVDLMADYGCADQVLLGKTLPFHLPEAIQLRNLTCHIVSDGQNKYNTSHHQIETARSK